MALDAAWYLAVGMAVAWIASVVIRYVATGAGWSDVWTVAGWA